MNFGSSGDSGGKPSNSMSDYYCDVCDANMNSLEIWEMHIAGKKHAKNLKKGSIGKPAEVKSVVKDITSFIQRQIDELDVPVIGLNHIIEINSVKPNSTPTYRCNLCQAAGDPISIIDHIISTRHRLNHMKEADTENYNMIEQLVLMKGSKDSLVEEKASLLEQKDGRGKIEVRLEVIDPKKRNQVSLDLEEFEGVNKQCFGPGFEDFGMAHPSYFGERDMMHPPRPPPPPGFELVGRVRFLPLEIRLQMLEDLSTVGINTDYEANVIHRSMNVLTGRVMEFNSSTCYPYPRASNFPDFRGPPGPPVRFIPPGHNFNYGWPGQSQDGYWKKVTF